MPRHLRAFARQLRAPEARKRERCAGRRSRSRVFAGCTRSSAVALRDSPCNFKTPHVHIRAAMFRSSGPTAFA